MPEELIPEARDLVAPAFWRTIQSGCCAGVAAQGANTRRDGAAIGGRHLVAAAWLHDIGYGSQLRDSGLRSTGQIPACAGRLAGPVRLRPCRASFR